MTTQRAKTILLDAVGALKPAAAKAMAADYMRAERRAGRGADLKGIHPVTILHTAIFDMQHAAVRELAAEYQSARPKRTPAGDLARLLKELR